MGSWAAHPLSKALLAQPLSHASLMLGTQRILSHAAQAEKLHQQLLQQLLIPFISFVLLRPDTTGMLRMLHLLRGLTEQDGCTAVVGLWLSAVCLKCSWTITRWPAFTHMSSRPLLTVCCSRHLETINGVGATACYTAAPLLVNDAPWPW